MAVKFPLRFENLFKVYETKEELRKKINLSRFELGFWRFVLFST